MAAILPFIYLAMPVLLLATGLIVGKMIENSHYKSIHERERRFIDVPATDVRHIPNAEKVEYAELVHGSVVVSIDHFKRFAAGLRKIFGGEIHAYSSLLDRARREAMLRMKEACPDADGYVNCRIETASISKGGQKTIGSVEIMAYATAFRYRR